MTDDKKTWTTRRVRAWNVKPGDVIEVVSIARGKWWSKPRTVEEVVPSTAWPGEIELHFRRWHMGWHCKRTALVSVRRLGTKP
jgi:hypothetical protein